MDTYPYGESWQSTVDRHSQEWRAYCEARSCVRSFLVTQACMGREAARRDWEDYLALVGKRRGPVGAMQLKTDFEMVGIREGHALLGSNRHAHYGEPLAA